MYNKKQLHTGWKTWDKHLYHFQNKKNNILEIGAYKGEASSWFLTNLCNHKDSRLYAVDTWEGSPEYPENTNFKSIEEEFNKTMKDTGKKNQLIKIKNISFKALIELNQKNIKFDIIYIDASHVSKDVLSDAVLSWNILKENGILIFDDYEWNILKKNYERPKLAIETFMKIYTTEIDILAVKRQVLLKKVKPSVNTNQLNTYYNLQESIRTYKFINFTYKIENQNLITYSLDLKLNKNPSIYSKKMGFSSTIKKIFDFQLKMRNDISYYQKNEIYDLNRFLRYMPNYIQFFDSLSLNIKNKLEKSLKNRSNNKPCLYKIFDFLGNNLELAPMETLYIIKKNNLFQPKEITTYLNFSYSNNHDNNKIRHYILLLYPNIKNIIMYDNNFTQKKNKNNNSDYLFKINIKNIHDVLSLSKQLKEKIDIMQIPMIGDLYLYNKSIDFEQVSTISLYYTVLIALMNQNKKGVMITNLLSILTEPTLQILIILKKYYKKIILTPINNSHMGKLRFRLIASDFQGISQKELKDFMRIGFQLTEVNPLFNNISSSYQYIESFISIDDKHTQKIHTELIESIKKINNKLYLTVHKNQELFQNILYYFDQSINKEVKKNQLKKYINQKQLEVFFEWIVNYDLLSYIKI
tara:strand:+ start:22 stop:1935 length:1914 start_codon:yes stop_codon:yes gene_type:complete